MCAIKQGNIPATISQNAQADSREEQVVCTIDKTSDVHHENQKDLLIEAQNDENTCPNIGKLNYFT